MKPTLTPRQRDVFELLGTSLTLRDIAGRLAINDSTLDAHRVELLRKFAVHSTDELRTLAAAAASAAASASTSASASSPSVRKRGSELKILKYERHALPNLPLSGLKPVSARCRRDFDARSLRDVADYVCDCDSEPGTQPDDYQTLLDERTGTIGAKQSLLAILAEECGRRHLQLMIACCEMPLPQIPTTGGGLEARPATLPLAMCWLKYRGRRLKIGEPSRGEPKVVNPITEVCVAPTAFKAERIRLYKVFAKDWCRALDVPPAEFARLRASQLQACAGTAQFEDLLGYGIAADYEPAA